jgi:hypothetical protein
VTSADTARGVQALSCQPAEHEAAVARLQSERRESARALRATREELAGMLADRLIATMLTSEFVAEEAAARRANWLLLVPCARQTALET